jgi:outer membrane receptor protein involved in Fe transport
MGVTQTSQTSGSRYWGFLSDYIYTAGGDLTKTFNLFGLSQSVKGGYLFQVKDRLFDSRPFAIYQNSDDPSIRELPADKVYAPENFGTGAGQFTVNELGDYRYRYLANTILNAGFIQFDNQFTDKLRATWGVRVEDYDQLIGSVKQSDPRHLHTEVRDFLPGINITYKIGSTGNLRLSGSQTVIRPEFRELSDFSFFDFDLGATVSGNKNLVRTKVSNADLRYELYPRAGEVFTVGVFYKYFKNPIELFFNPSSGEASTFNYINADKASGFGAELEYRKKLDFVEVLHNFTFQGNFSYIYNRVKQESAKLDRPMQGQSPYVVNASLQYDVEKLGLNATLLFNQIGRRIAYVGSLNDEPPPVWEAPRALLDFQIAKKVIKNKGEVKLNVSDIFNKAANFYYDLDHNKKYDKNSADALVLRRKYGTTFNIAFSYNIK